MHVLTCGHLITSSGPTTCAANCQCPAPGAVSAQYELHCRTCRVPLDQRFLSAAAALNLPLHVRDPLSPDERGQGKSSHHDQPEYVTLHDRRVPTAQLRRLADKMAGVKLWFAYEAGAGARSAHVFVLETSWARYVAERRTGSAPRGRHVCGRAALGVLREEAGLVEQSRKDARRRKEREEAECRADSRRRDMRERREREVLLQVGREYKGASEEPAAQPLSPEHRRQLWDEIWELAGESKVSFWSTALQA